MMARRSFTSRWFLYFPLFVLWVSPLCFSGTELAKVNQTVITLEEFNQKYEENLKFFPLKPPSKQAVLEDLIKRELGIQKAREQGLDKKAEIIDRMNTVLFNSLIEKELTQEVENIRISDQEAKVFYKKTPFIRTSHILVALAPNAKPEAEQRAMERIKKIQVALSGDKSFAEIAQTYSDGPAAAMGGDIDYQSKDRLDPLYYDAALLLKEPGKVSGIIRSSFGYHIIKLTGIRAWESVDKAQVKRAAFEEQKTKVFDKYMEKLRAAAKVTSHLELLKD